MSGRLICITPGAAPVGMIWIYTDGASCLYFNIISYPVFVLDDKHTTCGFLKK